MTTASQAPQVPTKSTAAVATAASDTRTPVEVAVGILIREEDGALLFCTRPPGKPYAGYWEFAGGKLEAGESVEQALRRELHEELGITIEGAAPWQVTQHDYPHALVRLHWCKVWRWQGTLQMREGQQMSWQHFPLSVHPILPGAFAVLHLLEQEHAHPQPLPMPTIPRTFAPSP